MSQLTYLLLLKHSERFPVYYCCTQKEFESITATQQPPFVIPGTIHELMLSSLSNIQEQDLIIIENSNCEEVKRNSDYTIYNEYYVRNKKLFIDSGLISPDTDHAYNLFVLFFENVTLNKKEKSSINNILPYIKELADNGFTAAELIRLCYTEDLHAKNLVKPIPDMSRKELIDALNLNKTQALNNTQAFPTQALNNTQAFPTQSRAFPTQSQAFLTQSQDLIPENGNDEYNKLVRFLNKMGQVDYNKNLLNTSKSLSEFLTFKELLNVNFNTNISYRNSKSTPEFLEYYIHCLNKYNNLGNEDPIKKNSVNALLHEFFYMLLSGKKIEQKNKSGMIKGIVCENIAAEYSTCPICNELLVGEHLQYRGDLVCLNCSDVDIDVKFSKERAKKHCDEFKQSLVKAELTRYSIYFELNKNNNYWLRLKDCIGTENDLILTRSDTDANKYLWKVLDGTGTYYTISAGEIRVYEIYLTKIYKMFEDDEVEFPYKSPPASAAADEQSQNKLGRMKGKGKIFAEYQIKQEQQQGEKYIQQHVTLRKHLDAIRTTLRRAEERKRKEQEEREEEEKQSKQPKNKNKKKKKKK
jgi:uncharacterized protein YjfI (DUF2170 family)